jgi:hypothetical protein
VDEVSVAEFEKDLKGNLYKIWNRMSSGTYFPPPVRLVEIPKASGGMRPLGIPTVADRVAQTVVSQGKRFMGFLPAISPTAAKRIRATMREWRLAATKTTSTLEALARFTNPVVRGWLHHYGQFHRSRCVNVLRHLNALLVEWVRRKYKRFRYRGRAAVRWLARVAQQDASLFVLWALGVRPLAQGGRAG